MKYFTTTFSLFFLSLLAALLSLYFGGLTRQADKEINTLKSQIDIINEQIRINELELVIHTNTKYLTELQKIYLEDNKIYQSSINLINLNDINNQNMKNFLKVSIK